MKLEQEETSDTSSEANHNIAAVENGAALSNEWFGLNIISCNFFSEQVRVSLSSRRPIGPGTRLVNMIEYHQDHPIAIATYMHWD